VNSRRNLLQKATKGTKKLERGRSYSGRCKIARETKLTMKSGTRIFTGGEIRIENRGDGKRGNLIQDANQEVP
jgi:hypothetical protein